MKFRERSQKSVLSSEEWGHNSVGMHGISNLVIDTISFYGTFLNFIRAEAN